MDIDLAGRTAFVTGASRGIGREIALALADAGANVALGARSDGIEETAAEVGEERALPVRTDVTDEASVRESIEATVETFGGLDVLVNNAGVAGPTAPIEDVSVEEFEDTLAVNLVGPFTMAKYAAPHLRESDQGTVVNIGSTGGKRPYPSRTPYSSSKAGLIGLSRTLSHEFADDGVTVNTITPGPTEGERADDVFEKRAAEHGVSPEEMREEMVSDLPLAELVPPGEIADLTVFMASGRARHLTSQDVSVSSGLVWW